MTTTATKEKPILFSSPMVRAIIEGRKFVTRRVAKAPSWSDGLENMEFDCDDKPLLICRWSSCQSELECPYGSSGDRLWVRETWQQVHHIGGGQWSTVRTPQEKSNAKLIYAADTARDEPPRWRPSIHMPRWASRLTLEIVKVSVERLQEITEEECELEGFVSHQGISAMGMFAGLWDELNKSRGYSWESNPWVWRIEFRRLP